MTSRPSFAAFVELEDPSGAIVYSGEAIYRPAKPNPVTGRTEPSVGIPDDAMRVRPQSTVGYQIWLSGEKIAAAAVYLERVSTCWWFVLDQPPAHPPTV